MRGLLLAALLLSPAHAGRLCPQRLPPQPRLSQVLLTQPVQGPEGEPMVAVAGADQHRREWFVMVLPGADLEPEQAWAMAESQGLLQPLGRRRLNARNVAWLGGQLNAALLAVEWDWELSDDEKWIYMGWGRYRALVKIKSADVDLSLTDVAKAIAGVLGGDKPKKNPVKVKGELQFIGVCYTDDDRDTEELRIEMTVKGKVSIDPVADTVELIRGLIDD